MRRIHCGSRPFLNLNSKLCCQIVIVDHVCYLYHLYSGKVRIILSCDFVPQKPKPKFTLILEHNYTTGVVLTGLCWAYLSASRWAAPVSLAVVMEGDRGVGSVLAVREYFLCHAYSAIHLLLLLGVCAWLFGPR